jgi:antirestriction protein ArdC
MFRGDAEHASGRVMRPLRGNGIPYNGINVLMLWLASIEKGCAEPVWMTFKQVSALKAIVRKGARVIAESIPHRQTCTVAAHHTRKLSRPLSGFSTAVRSIGRPFLMTFR